MWLTACGAMRPAPVRTELIDVPITLYAPLPAALTDPLPLPPAPPRNCRLPGGAPAVCALDGLLWGADLQAVLDRANADRASAAKLGLAPSLRIQDTDGAPWK